MEELEGTEEEPMGAAARWRTKFAIEAADLSEGTGIIRGWNNRPPIKVTIEPRRVCVVGKIGSHGWRNDQA